MEEKRREVSLPALKHFCSAGSLAGEPKDCYAIANDLAPNLQFGFRVETLPQSKDAFLLPNFTLNVPQIGSLLSHIGLENTTFEMENNDQPEMIAARELLAHVASVIHEYIYPRWKEARESWFDGLETLIGEDVLSFLAGVADDHFLRGHSALSAALFVSTIEGWLKSALPRVLRAKGNESAAARIPRKAVDFFSLPTLSGMLGEELTTVTRMLCGPPPGLNIRNVLWHGYLGDGEFPPELATLLIVHMFTLGHALACLLAPGEDGSPRLDSRVSIQEVHIPNINESHTAALACFRYEEVAQHCLELMEHTFAVIPNQVCLWKQAFGYLTKGDLLRFICVSVPLLEHTIRRIFVCVNDIDERLYQAQTFALMLTFDMMFAKRISPKGERLGELGNADDSVLASLAQNSVDPGLILNKLFDEFDAHTMHLLYDVFVWNEAPRVRDMVAHGVLRSHVPKWSVQLVVCVIVALFTKYRIKVPLSVTKTEQILSNYVKSYVPYFHLKAVLARGTEAISKQAAQMAQIAAQALVDRPPLQPLLKQPAIEIPISDIEARVDFAIAQIRAKTISTCKSFFLPNHEAEPAITSPYEVLFHSRDEYIKLKFMSIILDDVKTFGETAIASYVELHKKILDRTAWQAQRKCYIGMVDSMGVYPHVLRLFGALVESFINYDFEPNEYTRGALWHCIRILGTFKASAGNNAVRKCVELLSTFIGVEGVAHRILSKSEIKIYNKTFFVLYPEAPQPKPTQ